MAGSPLESNSFGDSVEIPAKKKKAMAMGKKGEGRRTLAVKMDTSRFTLSKESPPIIPSNSNLSTKFKEISPSLPPFESKAEKVFEQSIVTVGRVEQVIPRVLGDKSNLTRTSQNLRFSLGSNQIILQKSPGIGSNRISPNKLRNVNRIGTPKRIIPFRDPSPALIPTATIAEFQSTSFAALESITFPLLETNSLKSPTRISTPPSQVDESSPDELMDGVEYAEIPLPEGLEGEDIIEADLSEMDSSILLETHEKDSEGEDLFGIPSDGGLVVELEAEKEEKVEEEQLEVEPKSQEILEPDLDAAQTQEDIMEPEQSIEKIIVIEEIIIDQVVEVEEKSVEKEEFFESVKKTVEIEPMDSVDSSLHCIQEEDHRSNLTEENEPETVDNESNPEISEIDNSVQSIDPVEELSSQEATDIHLEEDQDAILSQSPVHSNSLEQRPMPPNPFNSSDSEEMEVQPQRVAERRRHTTVQPDSELSNGPPSSEDDLAYEIRTRFALSDIYDEDLTSSVDNSEMEEGEEEKGWQIGRRLRRLGIQNQILETVEDYSSEVDGLSIG